MAVPTGRAIQKTVLTRQRKVPDNVELLTLLGPGEVGDEVGGSRRPRQHRWVVVVVVNENVLREVGKRIRRCLIPTCIE